MSEAEKLERAKYQERRKKIIIIMLAVVLLFAILTAVFSVIFVSRDKDTYISYQEKGTALYHAYLNENEYYEEERLNGNHAYVSSLIHHMDVEFSYKSEMLAENVTYKYMYRIDAQLVVEDSKTGAAIYNPVETILGPTESDFSGQVLRLVPKVDIDYVRYNEKAMKFIENYKLKDVTSYLTVTMFVEVVGTSESFASDSEGQYNIQVKIPLAQNVLKPQVTSTIPAGPQQILANANQDHNVFRVLAVIFGILLGGAIITVAVYTVKTRDNHIDYARKVQRFVNRYRSFIQRINNPFDSVGYQELSVDTFNEMLEIRDTLQIPILMYENEDKTRAVFMIPVDGRLLYTFVIQVTNYDEIYSESDEAAEVGVVE